MHRESSTSMMLFVADTNTCSPGYPSSDLTRTSPATKQTGPRILNPVVPSMVPDMWMLSSNIRENKDILVRTRTYSYTLGGCRSLTPVRCDVPASRMPNYAWLPADPRENMTPLKRPVPPSSLPSSTAAHRSSVSPQPNVMPHAFSRMRFSTG